MKLSETGYVPGTMSFVAFAMSYAVNKSVILGILHFFTGSLYCTYSLLHYSAFWREFIHGLIRGSN